MEKVIYITVENPIPNKKGQIKLEMNIGQGKYYPKGLKFKDMKIG